MCTFLVRMTSRVLVFPTASKVCVICFCVLLVWHYSSFEEEFELVRDDGILVGTVVCCQTLRLNYHMSFIWNEHVLCINRKQLSLLF